MKNNSISYVVLLGTLAILGIIAIQSYLFVNNWDLQEKVFEERAYSALYKVAKEFEKIGNQLPESDLIRQIASNYYVVNVNDVINANNLQYFLSRELETVGLTDDFEYGIYDCGTGQMVYHNYISYSGQIDTTTLEKNALPIYDEYTYYFGVRFPGRNGRIFSAMSLTLTFSAILLVTILFFMFSIGIILRQKRFSEMQKDFINNMTHEFKTPISTIKISSDVFLNNPKIQEEPRLLEYAKIIRSQNQRLNRQVEKVLQLARIEQDHFQLNKESLHLHEILLDVLNASALKIEKDGGSLDWNLMATKDQIQADRLHLSNVLHNLLDNATKYCKTVPQVEVRTENSIEGLWIHIIDEGIGIPKEAQQRVFRKFYRVPTGNVHNVKGFGLGLFYVKNICDAHGWKVKLNSEEGAGTHIQILIPSPRPPFWHRPTNTPVTSPEV